MAILEKLGSNTLDHGLRNTKSNSKSSTPYFSLNTEVSRPSGVYVIPVSESIRAIREIESKTIIHRQGNMKNNSVFNSTFHIKGGFAQL